MDEQAPEKSENKVRIDREIGDDPTELEAVAAEVVAAKPIEHARIKNLRALIETVQRHPDAKLAPPREEREENWKPPAANSPDALTNLHIKGGEILDADCNSHDCRLTFTISGASFARYASFNGASFAAAVSFERSYFAGNVSFDGASFLSEGSFHKANFRGDASFRALTFAAYTRFDEATFDGSADFYQVQFKALARFDRSTYAAWARFQAVRFAGEVRFDSSRFTSRHQISFNWSFFGGRALLDYMTFKGDAQFDWVTFIEGAQFDRTIFGGDVSFDETRFMEFASFSGARFSGDVDGDLRQCFLRTANVASRSTHQSNRPRKVRLQPIVAAVRNWFAYEFGWRIVRSLGQLQILSRVSIIALFAVPIVVAFWPAMRALAGAYHREVAESHAAMDRLLLEIERTTAEHSGELPDKLHQRIIEATQNAHQTSNEWRSRLEAIINESPHIGATLALTFLAAVAVTIGLLIYQVVAPQEVRKHDEDEFIDHAHNRYPEDSPDREDGLRRAIEHLQLIAKRRPDRHPNFVSHHGDTIWIPPRHRIDWFQDWEPPPAHKSEEDDASVPAAGHPKPLSKEPVTLVPGAERRRITIEEGAKAEYWIKSRTYWGVACVSFGFYLVGIACLLTILGIQVYSVGEAAGWWGEQESPGAATRPATIITGSFNFSKGEGIVPRPRSIALRWGSAAPSGTFPALNGSSAALRETSAALPETLAALWGSFAALRGTSPALPESVAALSGDFPALPEHFAALGARFTATREWSTAGLPRRL